MHDPQPNVSPPTSYKTPSLPTLAALGVISATALVSGCDFTRRSQSNQIEYRTMGIPAEENIAEGGMMSLPGD